jgi:hypothetical protein
MPIIGRNPAFLEGYLVVLTVNLYSLNKKVGENHKLGIHFPR